MYNFSFIKNINMNLFLDIISPIPEFTVIYDNKILQSNKILEKEGDKLSDNIILCYQNLSEKLDLNKKLEKIIVTTGPGSYTSLRVGISFAKGLQISQNIKIAGISIYDQLSFMLEKKTENNIGSYIVSSNSQKFFCYKFNNNKVNYQKVDDVFELPKNINMIYYNHDPLMNISKNIRQKKFSLKENILFNLSKIKFKNSVIIKPIYISNNKILN
tara:strand:+ start:214 stop:858 length:645 start_codon:yes stop_codon:yes gene_type:complete